MRFLLASTLALLAATTTPVTAGAYEDEPPSLHSLIAASDLIVVGKIVRTAQVERDNEVHEISYNGKKRFIAVVATVAVEETLMGAPVTGTVKFVHPKRERMKGEPVYDPDQDGVWLFRRSERPNEYLANEVGRFQPRERKEQIKAIIAKFSFKDVGASGTDGGDKPPAPPAKP